MTKKIETKTDLAKLFEYMKELLDEPGMPVTHGDLIHTIHLTIGALLEQTDTVRRAVEAAIET